MKTVIAIDSFKGSLSTYKSGEAVKKGIKKVFPDAQCVISPIADGGEGTLDAVMTAAGGRVVETEVTNPIGEKRLARYGILPSGEAVVEIAEAAGITLIEKKKRNPLYTTTYGVGEIILSAIENGCRSFTVGLGGSVTNDGGVGMLQALGFEFLDGNGREIERGAVGLEKLASVRCDKAHPSLSECVFTLASDVKNPLCGKNGASKVFAPQKGGSPEDIERMDAWLERYADITFKTLGTSDKNAPGSGAAGGLGFAFISYLNAEMKSGIEVVTTLTGLEKEVATADIIVTGEGRLDAQSAMGKAPVGVAAIAKKYGKTVIAFSGCTSPDATVLNDCGIDAFFPILRTVTTLEEAIDEKNAFENLYETSVQVFRLIKIVGGIK